MKEVLIGIIVGAAVALLGQFIAYLFDIFKRNGDEHRKAKAAIKLMLQELSSDQSFF